MTDKLPTLTDHQMGAVDAAIDWYKSRDWDNKEDHFYLGGVAGTGKSTLLPVLIDKLGINPTDIAFCAPTGKAAKVMRDKFAMVGLYAECKTIHSTIYLPGSQKADALEKQLEAVKTRIVSMFDRDAFEVVEASDEYRELVKKRDFIEAELKEAYTEKDGPKFFLNPESKLMYKKLVICDEASMVGAQMAEDLKKFGVPVIAIGDPEQLPPVGDDPGLCIGKPDYFLSEIHRQALDNPIIWLSKLVREGKNLPVGMHGEGVRVVKRRDDDVTLDPERDLQVLCGTNKTRWRLTKQIRGMLGYKSTGPEKDEPLIVCKNSRDTPSLINGVMVQSEESIGDLVPGIATFPIKIIEEDGTRRTVPAYQGLFEEHILRQKQGATAPTQAAYKARRFAEHLDFGWVLTVHKSQGSQWDEVCVHDESGAFGEDAKRHLYTAVTRAAKRLTVVIP